MMKKYLLLALLFSLAFVQSFAGTLAGKLLDEKGEGLAFATVFVQGGTLGTTSNAKGDYELDLPAGTYTIVCQYIGYAQDVQKVTIPTTGVVRKDFKLKEQTYQIDEVVVSSKDEDPAYRIIRRAIKAREAHLKQIKTLQTSIYLKGVLRTRSAPKKVLGQKVDAEEMGIDSNGKGVIYLVEEVADYYSRLPNDEKTIIHSVKESGDPNGLGFAQLPPVITFYENKIDLGTDLTPRGLVSPIADGAMGFYKYKLRGQFTENRQIIYKIEVSPRRSFEPTVAGTIYIVNDEWAIHSLSLYSTLKQGMEKLDTIRLNQVYVPLNQSTWVPKSQLMYPAISIFGFDVTGNFVTIYDNQKVNQTIPDSVFKTKIISAYDKGATKKDTAYWEDARPIVLEADEERDYRLKDSLRLKYENPAYRDSMRRRGNRPGFTDIFLGKTFRTKEDKLRLSVNGLLWMTNFNSVEGLVIAPKIDYFARLDSNNFLTGAVAARHGFSNGRFNAIGRITYINQNKEWRGRAWSIGAEGGRYVFQYNPENPVEPVLNTVSTLLYNQNYLKLYERWQAGLRIGRNYGTGLSWSLKGEFQRRMPLYNTTDYSWAKSSRGPISPNIPTELLANPWYTHNATIATARINYKPGIKYIQYPDFKSPVSSNWPTFGLEYTKGIPDILDSKTDYDKWKFDITGEANIGLLGGLSYRLATGGFLRDNFVSLPDLKHLDGNQYFIASPYLSSFQFAPYYRYSNTAKLYGEAHIEYNLFGLLTNKLPVFRRLKWYFILGTNTFYAGQNNYYTEAFVSIDNIGVKLLRFLRVDFVQSWDAFGRRNSGVRIGLHSLGQGPARRTAGYEW